MKLIGFSQNSLIQNQNEEKLPTPPEIKPKKYKQRQSQPKKKICTKNKSKSKNARTNHWNEFQQRRYIKFLQQSGHLMLLSFREKRNMKVNEMMSKRVKTRDASQCHSHHQKMLFTHSSIEEIIQNYVYLLQNEQKYFVPKKEQVQPSIKQLKDETIRQQPHMPIQQIEDISQFIQLGPQEGFKTYETLSNIQNDFKPQIEHNEIEEIDSRNINDHILGPSLLQMAMGFSANLEDQPPSIIYLFREDDSMDWHSTI